MDNNFEENGSNPNTAISERVKRNILETPKRKKLKIREYLEDLYSSSGIKENEKKLWPDVGRENQDLMELVFNSLKSDWQGTTEPDIKSSIKGQLVEWLVLKSMIERYGKIKPEVFDVYKSCDPVIDKKFYTDLFIKAPISETKGYYTCDFGIDITISKGNYEQKMFEYKQNAKNEAVPHRFKGIPVLIEVSNEELEELLEYQEKRKDFAEKFYKEAFLPQISGQDLGEMLQFRSVTTERMAKYIDKFK